MDIEKMKQQLLDRLAENLADYRAGLLTQDRQELIDGAARIAETANVCKHLTERTYTGQELEYLLQFQNPLEAVTDHWMEEYTLSLDALDTAVADMVEAREGHGLYPMMADAPASKPEPLRRFMNVDILASMESILGRVTASYQSDFQYDRKNILRAARSEDPETRNFLWVCRSSGTHLHKERDVFIRGTASFNNVQFYHHDCRSEQVTLYGIEITGMKNGVVRGNIYERDRDLFAEYAARASSPYTDVTLTFADGSEARVPQQDYFDARNELEYHHGKLTEVRNEAEDETVVQGALRREHAQRERLPKGVLSAHLQKLADRQIHAEADRIASALQKLKEPNSPGSSHFMAQLSYHFTALAGTAMTEKLLHQLQQRFPGENLFFTTIKDRQGQYCFKSPAREQAQARPSIKAQLAAAPVPSDKPAAKTKDREVR